MKKYLGILIIFLTVFSFNMEVNAAQELTCLYDKEFFSNKYILVQKSTGSHILYENSNDESFIGTWSKSDEQVKFEDGVLNSDAVLDSCPKYINSAGDGVTFYNSKAAGRRELEDSLDKAQEPYMYSFKSELDSNGNLLNGLCGISSTKGEGTCTYITNNGSTYTGSYDGVMSTEINNSGGLKEFYVKGAYNDLETLKNYLLDRSCSSTDNCYEYVKEKYCGNFTSSEGICKDLKEENNQTIDETEEVGTCNVPVTFYTSDNKTETLKFEYNLTSKKISVLSNDTNIFVSGTSQFIGYNNTFYLKSKISLYDNFESKYIEILESTKKCPEISFCLYSRDGKKYEWYTEFDGCNFDSYKKSYSQNINSDGTSSRYNENGEDVDRNATVGNITEYESCEDFLSGESAAELVDILGTVIFLGKIVVPILLIVFSVLDFAKAIFGGDDQMKKAQSKLMKRVIIAVVIFLVPVLLKFVLTIASQIWPNISSDLCGIL